MVSSPGLGLPGVADISFFLPQSEALVLQMTVLWQFVCTSCLGQFWVWWLSGRWKGCTALNLNYLGSGLQRSDTHFIAGLQKGNYVLWHSEMRVCCIENDALLCFLFLCTCLEITQYRVLPEAWKLIGITGVSISRVGSVFHSQKSKTQREKGKEKKNLPKSGGEEEERQRSQTVPC